jgi:hypothetical protein
MRFMRRPDLAPLIPVALGVTMLGYILPWLTGKGAALSFHAYDLAEWTTLMPASSLETPPLLTAFLLRLPLLCMGVISAVFSVHQRGWARVAFVGIWLALAGANLPPFEFLSYPDNPNYRQQAVVAALTIGISGVMMLPFVRHAIRPDWIGAAAAVIGAAAALTGMARGHMLLADYGLDMQGGIGGISCAAGFILCALIHLSSLRKAG